MRTLVAPCALAALALVSTAQADVVSPPPNDCPPGHKPVSSHGGPYCRPPLPTSCPPEHQPRVYRSLAYCEPPPAKPCPPGSTYASKSPTDTYCVASRVCTSDDECSDGPCVDTAFCIRWDYPGGRRRIPIVAGNCDGDGTCADEMECVKHKRCDRTNKRVASSPSAAAPVEPASPPQPATASPSSQTGPAAPVSTQSPPASAPKSTGCAGCVVTAPPQHTDAGALALVLLLLRRRRRRH